MRELQELEHRLAAQRPQAATDYRAAVSRQAATMRKEVFQSGVKRLNTRNRNLRGKALFNQNKPRRREAIGSLAAFDPSTGG